MSLNFRRLTCFRVNQAKGQVIISLRGAFEVLEGLEISVIRRWMRLFLGTLERVGKCFQYVAHSLQAIQ